MTRLLGASPEPDKLTKSNEYDSLRMVRRAGDEELHFKPLAYARGSAHHALPGNLVTDSIENGFVLRPLQFTAIGAFSLSR